MPEFVCSECTKPFKSKAGLGSHLRKVHGIEGQGKDAVRRKRRSGAPTAMELTEVVAEALFPDGKVPVAKLEALIEFHSQAGDIIARLQS